MVSIRHMLKRLKTENKEGETSNSPQKEMGGGETSNPSLECSICFHPLSYPLYQCENGHARCLSCWSKVRHKCHFCNIRVQCRNITSAKSLCRIPGCGHEASSGEWRGHFRKVHRFPRNDFIYGQLCTILLNKFNPYHTLYGPDGSLFLLVKERIRNVWIALSLYCVDGPHLGQNDFKYELMMKERQLKSPVVSIKDWKRGKVCGSRLLVPDYDCMKVHVLIYKELDVIC